MKDNICDISIIIPLYNCEEWIEKTLVCLTKCQNWKQSGVTYEIIVVDDGSTDNSATVVANFIKTSINVYLFTQENKGVASARNLGLANSSGEYIYFIDADDFIAPNSLPLLINTLHTQRADIIIFKHTKCDESRVETFYHNLKQPENIDIEAFYSGKEFIDSGKFENSTVIQIIRRRFIVENNLSFDERLTFCEDTLFNLQLYSLNPKICYIPQILYIYNQRSVSLTRPKNLAGHLSNNNNFLIVASEINKIIKTEIYTQNNIPHLLTERQNAYLFSYLLSALRQHSPTPDLKRIINNAAAEGIYPLARYKNVARFFDNRLLWRFLWAIVRNKRSLITTSRLLNTLKIKF